MPVTAVSPQDDFRLRRVQVPFYTPHLPLPNSSIKPVAQNPISKVIDSHMKTERLAEKGAQLFDLDVTKSMAEISQLSDEKQAALEKEAEAAKSRSTWSTLSTVANCVTSVAAITAGIAVGGWPGILFGLSGGIGVINEVQSRITNHISTNAYYLQMALGCAAGVGAWQAGSFAAAQATSALAAVQKANGVIGTASTVLSTSSHLGTKIYDKKMADLQARMKEINGQITTDQQTIQQDTAQISRMIETDQFEADEVRKAIQNNQVSWD